MFKNFAKIVAGAFMIAVAAVVVTCPVTAAAVAFCGVVQCVTGGIDEMERR